MIRSLFVWYESHEKSIPNIFNGCYAWRWSDSATQGGVTELCALDTLEYLLIQSIKKVWEIFFSWGENPLNPAQFATCPPSVFRHSCQANSALGGPKFRAGGPKFCTGPIICTSSKFCLVLDLVTICTNLCPQNHHQHIRIAVHEHFSKTDPSADI